MRRLTSHGQNSDAVTGPRWAFKTPGASSLYKNYKYRWPQVSVFIQKHVYCFIIWLKYVLLHNINMFLSLSISRQTLFERDKTIYFWFTRQQGAFFHSLIYCWFHMSISMLSLIFMGWSITVWVTECSTCRLCSAFHLEMGQIRHLFPFYCFSITAFVFDSLNQNHVYLNSYLCIQ